MDNIPNLAITCLGGSCPGLNGVIVGLSIFSEKSGWNVMGIEQGFEFLIQENYDECLKGIKNLYVHEIRHLATDSSSLLSLSRFKPQGKHFPLILQNLTKLGIKYLVVLCGTRHLLCLYNLSKFVSPSVQILVIPKTIDNDIPLNTHANTFGYETARIVASSIVTHLNREIINQSLWYIVELMGKETGHLALSVAEGSLSPLCIIPEDFGDHNLLLEEICDVIEAGIAKSSFLGYPGGICIISESLIQKMKQEAFSSIFGLSDPSEVAPTTSLDDANLCEAIASELRLRFQKRSVEIRLISKKIGYELRGCAPLACDVLLAKRLSFAAIEGMKTGKTGQVVIWNNGIKYLKIEDMIAEDGLIYPRKVDVKSEKYHIAQLYMRKLNKDDFQSPENIQKIAATINLSSEEFESKFKWTTELL